MAEKQQIKKPTAVTVSSEKTSTEIVAQNNTPANFDVQAIIEKAITQKIAVEQLQKLLDLAERMRAIYAKSEFDKAMSHFQSECPIIQKKKSVNTNDGKLAYRYAPLEDIVDQVKKALSNNDLSYSTQIEIINSGVRAIVTAKHIAGHSEVSIMEVPLGNKTNVMSNSQVTAAASTFAKRYAFCNVFGIMTGDEDTDASLESTAIKAQTAPQTRVQTPVQQTSNQPVKVQPSPAPAPQQPIKPASKAQLDLVTTLMAQRSITPEQVPAEFQGQLTSVKASSYINILLKTPSKRVEVQGKQV